MRIHSYHRSNNQDAPLPAQRVRRIAMLVSCAAVLVSAGAVSAQVINVPGDVATLQQAINTVADGGTIRLATGTYSSPTDGFLIVNANKAFTIEAAAGANPVLDGGNARSVVFFQNASVATGRPVVFRNLTFRNGRATVNATGGAVTLQRAEATFVDCLFENNTSRASQTGGGALAMFDDSVAHLIGTVFRNNTAINEGGAIKVDTDSTAFLQDCEFENNRVDIPGHRTTAVGGAISVGNARMFAAHSRFSNNAAGFAGGAVMVIGSWTGTPSIPAAEVVMANCTFEDNFAEADPGVTTPSPTEGGAVHVEDQALVRIYSSRFVENRAELGGALSLYRSRAEVQDSVFLGNRIDDIPGVKNFGGTIKISSSDVQSFDGNNNRPASELTVRGSYLQGRFGSTTTAAESGACIVSLGDANRAFGLNSTAAIGTPAQNRAKLTVQDSLLVDCDTYSEGSNVGDGGGINVTLTDLTVQDSMILGSDANSQAGALRVVTESTAQVTGSTMAGNTAGTFGGAVFVQGANLDMSGSRMTRNQVAAGAGEPGSTSFGAAVFSGPLVIYSRNMNATGTFSNNVISDQLGIPVFEDDSHTQPINDLRYNGNTLFNTSHSSSVYRNAIDGPGRSPTELNSLVINRTSAPSTNKSQQNNSGPGSAPVVGDLIAAPAQILARTAAGDTATSTQSFLGWAWSGGGATLDGSPVTGNWGWQSRAAGNHNLQVAGQNFAANISNGSLPAATFTAVPASISSGQSATLSWNLTSGTFLAGSVDQGVILDAAAAGTRSVSPSETTTYGLYILTEEGAVWRNVTVFVDELPGAIFTDGFEGGNVDAWTNAVP